MSKVTRGKSPRIVSVDTGGTFTDALILDGGRLESLKTPSTLADPADAVLEGVAKMLGAAGGEYLLLHGSTVATNSLLERDGARVMLVTNAGFEDVIEIGRQNRPQLYALVGHRPSAEMGCGPRDHPTAAWPTLRIRDVSGRPNARDLQDRVGLHGHSNLGGTNGGICTCPPSSRAQCYLAAEQPYLNQRPNESHPRRRRP